MKIEGPPKPPQPKRLDYALTYLTTLGLVVTAMLTYRVAAQSFGEMGLSQYALMRRIIAFIQPTLALGLAVALSRSIAARRFDSRSSSESSYLLAGLVIILASTLAFLVFLLLCPELIAYAFFGSTDYYRHTLALCPMFVGLSLHVVCYAQLHGRFSMRLANMFQLVNIGVIPLIAILCTSSLDATFWWTGFTVALVSISAIGSQLRNVKTAVQGVFPAIRELLRLGPARVPGDVALAALMVMPATMAAHSCGLKQGGLVAFCVTLLTLAQTTTTPISTLLLPQATAMLRCGDVAELRSKVLGLLAVSLSVTASGIVFFWLATDFVLTLCVGKYAAELPGLAQIIILGALPLNSYTCLRSIVDAGRDRAVNARSICLSLVCFFVALPIARYAAARRQKANASVGYNPIAAVKSFIAFSYCPNLR